MRRLRRSATALGSEHRIIILGVFAAMFAWAMWAGLDLFFYPDKSYQELLFQDLPLREIISRAAIAASFLLAAVIVSRTVRKLASAETRAKRLDTCIRSVRAVNQLITRETDRDTLCRRVCEVLVERLGYARVEIMLDGAARGLAESTEPSVIRRETGPDEPVAVPVECAGETLGELRVTLGELPTWDDDERDLLVELAEDIAFGVRDIGMSENLAQQREELQTILDSISAYISYADSDCRYLSVNKVLADLVGIRQSAWIGKSRRELFPDASAESLSMHAEVIASGMPRRNITEKLELPSGTRWVQTDRIPYRDGDGNTIGVIELSIDVTEQKDAEAALVRKEAELRQAQKMEAIGHLAGGIAHDFNNLLTAISGYAELAERRAVETDPIVEDLAAITQASNKAAALTHQLLAFSRRQPLKLAVQDPNAIVHELCGMLQRLIGEDIELQTSLDPDVGKIEADASQIEQVLLNLAVNARDAMPEGGSLTISTASAAETEQPSEGWSDSKGGPSVRFSITDTGVGMDERTLSHMFEPFYTTKSPGSGPGSGTGLGLSVVHGIVKQHGGWIRTETIPGRGTTFRVYLPLCPVKAADSLASDGESEINEEDLRGNGARVLLIEDEEMVRTFAAHALRDSGYEIVDVGTAEEALEILDAEQFDVVFSDIVLPGKSGVQLAEELTTLRPDVRMLLSSGYPNRESHGLQPREWGFALLDKPYSVKGLLEALHRVRN